MPIEDYKEYFKNSPELQLFRNKVELSIVVPFNFSPFNFNNSNTSEISCFFSYELNTNSNISELCKSIQENSDVGWLFDFDIGNPLSFNLNSMEKLRHNLSRYFRNKVVGESHIHFRKCIYKEIFDSIYCGKNIFPICTAGLTRHYLNNKGEFVACKYSRRKTHNILRNDINYQLFQSVDYPKVKIINLIKESLCLTIDECKELIKELTL